MAKKDNAHPQMPAPGTRTRARDAAILMLAVGEEHAAKIFSLMEEHEIRDISREMSFLGQVPSEEVERVLVEFATSVSGGGGLTGSWQHTERLLKTFMDEERVSEIMEEMRGPAGRTMWEKLDNVSEDILANYIRNEYPQTAAVILSKIKSLHAARVLSVLPQDFAFEVMERMLVMDNVPREIISTVEQTLRNEFMRNLSAKSKRDSHEMLAEVFNNFDRTNEAKFMEMLQKYSPKDADRVRSLMFTFEDLLKADDKGIQALMRDVEKDKVALALKGASEDLKKLFFKNMSERASKIMQEDMQAMGPVRVKDVDDAQQAVITVAKKLIDDGQLVIPEEGGEDEFIT